MSVSVGAVVVFEGDLAALALTIEAIQKQTTKPQQICVVLNQSSAEATAWVAEQKLTAVSGAVSAKLSIELALEQFAWWANDSQHYLWLLSQETVPEPNVLAELLRTVERSPSVAVVSPKLLKGQTPRYLHQVGLTLTRWGGLFSPAFDQLDQAQFDAEGDTLAVSEAAALVRADVWFDLKGFDARFSKTAQTIDFCIRARLAGYRVEVAPAAQVKHFGAAEFTPKQKRRAELELKAAFAPVWMLLLIWLALPIWGLIRAFYQVAAKNLELVSVELLAAAGAFLKPWMLLARHRQASRRALSQMRGLRATWAEVLAQRRDAAAPAPSAETGSRVMGRGWWLALLVGLNLSFWPTGAATGGGALGPLSENWLLVFSHAGASWQAAGFGAAIPADPINWFFAAISLVTFWNPSLAVSLLLLFARALAFWGAERFFKTLTKKPGAALIMALVFAFWPALTSSLLAGNLGAVISLVTAPWLLNSLLSLFDSNKTRIDWLTQVAVSGLLLATTLAASPSTAPLWLLVIVALAINQGKRALRVGWALIPSAVIFAPLAVFMAVGLRHPLLVLVDPLQAKSKALTLWQALLGGNATLGKDFWQLSSGWPLAAVLLCLVLLVVVTLISSNQRTLPLVALFTVAIGYGWLISNISVLGANPSQNADAVLGLAGLTLLSILVIGFDSIGARRSLVVATSLLVLLPFMATALLSTNQVKQTNGQVLPAIVQAEWKQGNRLRVLQLTGSREIAAQLVTPENLTLDGQSLGYQVSGKLRSGSQEVEQLSLVAANLAAASASNLDSALRDLGVGFVFAPSASGQLISALDSSPQLEAVGNTKLGRLWRVTQPAATIGSSAPNQSQIWSITKTIQLGVLVIFVLMALPTGARIRRQRDSSFDEGGVNDAS